MTVEQIIAIATKEIGVCENPPTSNKVKYNDWFYGHSVSGTSYPWCATFICWLFKGTGLVPKTASCANMLEYFEVNNQIVKKPIPGDLVFFKYSTNNRRTNHVGLVIAVNGDTITTIEGNTSKTSQDNGGKVMKRTRKSCIIAYARPRYENIGSSDLTPRKTIWMGSRGEDVKYLQQKLASFGYHVGGADGIFGVNTCNAVIEFQTDHKLHADGIVGVNTWAKIESI